MNNSDSAMSRRIDAALVARPRWGSRIFVILTMLVVALLISTSANKS